MVQKILTGLRRNDACAKIRELTGRACHFLALHLTCRKQPHAAGGFFFYSWGDLLSIEVLFGKIKALALYSFTGTLVCIAGLSV